MRIPLGILLACGALAGWLLAGVVPSGLLEQCRRDVVTQPFHLSRVVEVTESSWFFLPQLWGDFDLNMDLELSAGAEVDVLLRQVEPRFVDEVQLPFTGRFAALRITADDPGREPADEQQAERGWRTREQALFGSRGDGVRLAPGRPATIWIEGRGATLTANVGGKRQEPFEADDVYGMLAVLVRDGKAVIHRLDMLTQPIAGEWRWRPLTWAGFGLLAALLVAAFASLLSRRRQFAAAGGTLLGLTWVLGRGVELDLMFPDPLGMAVLLAVPAVFATLVAVQRGRVLLAAVTAVAVVVAGGALWPDALAAPVRAALGGDDASAVEEVFGPDAGEQPSKALAQLVRMPNGLIDREKRGARAFLL
ncbi:MAG: hypothetical protein KAI24_14090, partial [Planctomycetes bacterium]|nr:hypothetical protein [Planctomycetota bacterium]